MPHPLPEDVAAEVDAHLAALMRQLAPAARRAVAEAVLADVRAGRLHGDLSSPPFIRLPHDASDPRPYCGCIAGLAALAETGEPYEVLAVKSLCGRARYLAHNAFEDLHGEAMGPDDVLAFERLEAGELTPAAEVSEQVVALVERWLAAHPASTEATDAAR